MLRRLPLFWRFQLTGTFVLWCTAVLYCLGIMNDATAALAMATFATVVESGATLLLRAYYHRIAPRRFGDGLLLTHIVVVSGVCGMATHLVVSAFVVTTGFTPRAPTLATQVASVGTMSMIYLTWSLLYFGIKRTREAQRAKELLHETQMLAARAEIAMLRYQVNPHFLFNSLASLRQQILEDTGKARQMTTELAGYLRYTLARTEATLAPLDEELRAIEKYLAVERTRFEDRVAVTFAIEDVARQRLVPPFLLQPLVENALKYGASQNPQRLELQLSSRIADGRLVVEVANSGRWIAPTAQAAPGHGIGLANVRRRLENLFPGRHAFATSEANGFVRVRVEVWE